MPKKGAKGGKARARRAGGRGGLGADVDQTIRVKGQTFVTIATAITVQAYPLSPLLLDPRLLAMSDLYQEYRFVKLRVKAWCDDTVGAPTVPVTTLLAYTPVLLSTAPTNVLMPSLPVFAMGNGFHGSPNPGFRVPKRELTANAPKWFRRGTAYDDLLEVQGTIYVGRLNSGFSSVNHTLWIEYEIELRAPADAALTHVPNPLKPPSDVTVSTVEEKLEVIEEVLGLVAPPKAPPVRTSTNAEVVTLPAVPKGYVVVRQP